MGRSSRENVRIEQRRQHVADCYLKGWSQAAIARELDVSQATVSADLKVIRREWRESRVRDFDDAVELELRKIAVIEREAWAGWERSQQPLESSRVMQGENGKHLEKSVQQQVGNPRFLEQIQKAIAARRALLGLDAPVRVAPTSPDGSETYHAHVMQELLRLAEQTIGGPTVIDADYVDRTVAQELLAVNGSQPRDGSNLAQGVDQ